MNKKIISLISFLLLTTVIYAEQYTKKSTTPDGYEIEFKGSTENDGKLKYVILDSKDTKEKFYWEFDKFNEAMEHFKWLEEKNFGSIFSWKRSNWREYSYKATVVDDYICFYISKKQRLEISRNSEWRL